MQLFDDTYAAAGKDPAHPRMKAFADCFVAPLAQTYVSGRLDWSHRERLMRALASIRDARALPAWEHAIRELRSDSDAQDAAAAVRAIADSGVRESRVLDAIGAAFVRLEAGSEQGGLVFKQFMDAMRDISAPTWETLLLERIDRPMVTIERDASKDTIRAYRNEQFWQVTSAEILGNLKSTRAIRPLLKCVVNPNKTDIAATAVMSLVKIGKPAVPMLSDILLGKDQEVNDYARALIQQDPEAAVTRNAAMVLGTVGCSEGTKPLMDALARSSDDVTRAVLARELSKLPPSAASLAAYLDVMMKMPASVDLPTGESAVEMLLERVDAFFDPAVIDKLLKRGREARGSDDEVQAVRDQVLVSLIRLMKKEHVAKVEKAIQQWAPRPDESKLEKEAFAASKELVIECGDKIPCYLAKLDDPAIQENRRQMTGIKAAYMIGILGYSRRESVRNEVLLRLPRIRNAAIKYVAGRAIDHLTPDGDQAVADGLSRLIEDNRRTGDQNLMIGDNPLKQIRWRVLARLPQAPVH